MIVFLALPAKDEAFAVVISCFDVHLKNKVSDALCKG